MTAPDLVEVITKALSDSWDDATEYGTPEDMARAVLDALAEAGNVEWGLRHGDRPRVERCYTERYAKQCAAESGSTLVSRLTLPWSAVE